MIEYFKKNGFLVVNNFLSVKETQQCLKSIKTNINEAAKELEVKVEDYLSCTGRWTSRSPVTRNISAILNEKIKKYLENLLQSEIIYKKSNVICKTSAITDAIPFHQDISYNARDPYHFSLWLSLNGVTMDSAPLRVLENSHKEAVKPAVDFWFPHFVDQYSIDNTNIRTLTVNAGDAIIFDSKLWHGSQKNYSHKDRFAYVTRWVIEGKNFPKIPATKAAHFGMFNCEELTNQILNKSLIRLDVKKQEKVAVKDELIALWIDILNKNPNIWGINCPIAIKDLEKLNILNKTYELHDAGSISGSVYKNLWHSLLSIINSKISLINILQNP